MFGFTLPSFFIERYNKSACWKTFTEKLLLQFLQDLYVDDTATSFNDLTNATEFYHVTKSILASGGFKGTLMQNWKTTDMFVFP